jgi:hypothetical protein
MATNRRVMRCAPEDVFAVLRDGWLFPGWVVGASRMRAVDEEWPAAGSAIHHSFGIWPVLINDDTTVDVWNPPHSMTITPKGWPFGEARVELEVVPHRRGCRVRIREHAVSGPGTWIPSVVMEPAIYLRNFETLRRLSYLAEGRARPRS